MTLPVSGNSISMSQINNELHFAPTRRNNLDLLPFRNLAGKLTGSVSFSDYFGKASRQVYTRTYSASSTFTVPAGTTSIISASGYGGVGSTGYTYISGYTLVKTVNTSAFIPPYPSISTEVINTTVTETPTTASATVPADSGYGYYVCSSPSAPIAESQPCYRYDSTTYTKRTDYTTVPDVYGGSTTAFGKSFSGTYGSTPTLQTFTNIAVTPGQTYTLSLPSGGYLTFSYEADTPTYVVNSGVLVDEGTITIPANIINNTVTVIGSGGPGTTTVIPGQPAVEPTYDTQQNEQSATADTTPDCSAYPGASATNIRYVTVGSTDMVYWDCPVTTMTDPGSPEVPDQYVITTGDATIAQIGTDLETFPGGAGGPATELTKQLTTGAGVTSTLYYKVATGGTLSYSYLTL